MSCAKAAAALNLLPLTFFVSPSLGVHEFELIPVALEFITDRLETHSKATRH